MKNNGQTVLGHLLLIFLTLMGSANSAVLSTVFSGDTLPKYSHAKLKIDVIDPLQYAPEFVSLFCGYVKNGSTSLIQLATLKKSSRFLTLDALASLKNRAPKLASRLSIEGERTLVLSQLTRADEGTGFQCSMTYKESGIEREIRSSLSLMRTIYSFNTFSLSKVNRSIATEFQTFTVICTAQAYPRPTFSWFQGKTKLASSSSENRVINETGLGNDTFKSTLSIARTRPQHSGEYKCVAKNAGEENSGSFTLEVEYFGSTTSNTTDIIIKEGFPLVISCESLGNPIPNLVWIKQSKILSTTTNMKVEKVNYSSTTVKSRLTLPQASINSSGIYTCHGKNKLGENSTKIRVDVLYIRKPVINTTEIVTRNEGSNYIVFCAAEGNPLPQITWLKNSVLVHGTETSEKGKRMVSMLTLKGIKIEDSGQYKCRSRTNSITSEVAFDLRVLAKPGAITANHSCNSENIITVCVQSSTSIRNGSGHSFYIRFLPVNESIRTTREGCHELNLHAAAEEFEVTAVNFAGSTQTSAIAIDNCKGSTAGKTFNKKRYMALYAPLGGIVFAIVLALTVFTIYKVVRKKTVMAKVTPNEDDVSKSNDDYCTKHTSPTPLMPI